MYVLRREGCALVGGHTSEGAETAMGLSVTGVGHPDKVFYKGLRGGGGGGGDGGDGEGGREGGEVEGGGVEGGGVGVVGGEGVGGTGSGTCGSGGHMGHVLVLTKAIGTGTIMAAHMRAKVRARPR